MVQSSSWCWLVLTVNLGWSRGTWPRGTKPGPPWLVEADTEVEALVSMQSGPHESSERGNRNPLSDSMFHVEHNASREQKHRQQPNLQQPNLQTGNKHQNGLT